MQRAAAEDLHLSASEFLAQNSFPAVPGSFFGWLFTRQPDFFFLSDAEACHWEHPTAACVQVGFFELVRGFCVDKA
jgi:hypothetical protein